MWNSNITISKVTLTSSILQQLLLTRGTRPKKRRDYYLKQSPLLYFASIAPQTNFMTSSKLWQALKLRNFLDFKPLILEHFWHLILKCSSSFFTQKKKFYPCCYFFLYFHIGIFKIVYLLKLKTKKEEDFFKFSGILRMYEFIK